MTETYQHIERERNQLRLDNARLQRERDEAQDALAEFIAGQYEVQEVNLNNLNGQLAVRTRGELYAMRRHWIQAHRCIGHYHGPAARNRADYQVCDRALELINAALFPQFPYTPHPLPFVPPTSTKL